MKRLSDFNFTNIKSFFEGSAKYFLDKFGPVWAQATPLVQEQVAYRAKVCQPCLDNGSCVICGCKTPENFFATKGCRKGEYPLLLTQEAWDDFKANELKGLTGANRKYYQIWECECGTKNAHPYDYCYKCEKSCPNVEESIKKYIDAGEEYDKSRALGLDKEGK